MNSPYRNNDLFNRERIVIDFSDLDIRNFTQLGRLNYSKAHPPLNIHAHKNTLEICYLARGRQTYTVNAIEYTLTGGDIYFTLPDELHGTGSNPEEKSVLYWVLINFDNADNFLYMDVKESHRFLNLLGTLKNRKTKGNLKFKGFLDKIINVYYSDSEFKKPLIQSYITEFLCAVIELEKGVSSSISDDIQKTLEFIGLNIKEKITIEELSELINLSMSRFKQKFRQETGIPPGEYILREKVNRTEEIIKSTKRNITDIAYEFGFSSSHYFATVFKRITGKTPTEFRKV
jgi:AraC-like DNA-binding protein